MSRNVAPATEKKTARSEQPKKARGTVTINPERCKGCGYCVEFCPTGVLALSPKFNTKGYHYPESAVPEKCTGCDLCGMFCPDFAICGNRIST